MAADLERTNDNFSKFWNSFQEVHARWTRVLPWDEGSVFFFLLYKFSCIFPSSLEHIMAPVIPTLSPFLRETVANLRPWDGFQIQYSSTRSADLLGFDLFQLFSVLLTHGSNASQMYQAEWLDRLTSGKEQSLRKKQKWEARKKKVKQRLEKNQKVWGCHQIWMHSVFCHCYSL